MSSQERGLASLKCWIHFSAIGAAEEKIDNSTKPIENQFCFNYVFCISKKVGSMDWNLGHIRVLKAINNSQGNTKAPSFKRLGKHIFNRIQ